MKERDKILVIDDEFGPRESLRFLFKNGYDVTCADSVDQGIERLRAEPPDVIVMDIKMPGKTGIEGLREIREIDPYVAVVMLTGFGSLETAQEAIRLGANDYIKKPFDTKEMTRTIAGYIEKTKVARVRARTADELETLNHRLREELDRKDELASLGQASSEFVHDLRNPLAVICGYVEILSDELRQADQAGAARSGDLLDYLSRIEKNVLRCQEMSHMWRNLGKRDDERFVPCDVRELLDDLRADSARLASDAGARIDWHPGPGDLRVRADAVQLLRALQNLVSNAIQALPSGGGVVELSWDADAESVEVRVSDNGCGIDEDKLMRIFEPYYTTKQGSGGMGLGLFIANKVIEAHHGKLTLANREGGGATARVVLPLLDGGMH